MGWRWSLTVRAPRETPRARCVLLEIFRAALSTGVRLVRSAPPSRNQPTDSPAHRASGAKIVSPWMVRTQINSSFTPSKLSGSDRHTRPRTVFRMLRAVGKAWKRNLILGHSCQQRLDAQTWSMREVVRQPASKSGTPNTFSWLSVEQLSENAPDANTRHLIQRGGLAVYRRCSEIGRSA